MDVKHLNSKTLAGHQAFETSSDGGGGREARWQRWHDTEHKQGQSKIIVWGWSSQTRNITREEECHIAAAWKMGKAHITKKKGCFGFFWVFFCKLDTEYTRSKPSWKLTLTNASIPNTYKCFQVFIHCNLEVIFLLIKRFEDLDKPQMPTEIMSPLFIIQVN